MLDGNIGEFMADRARSTYEAFISGLSEKQERVISADAVKKADHIIKSDLGKAIMADYQATVDPLALWPKVDDQSRCPCGSGKNFGECHGRK
jgi:hypothetical protein